MQCPRCQHENPPATKFCGECAAPLAATCPSCGAANPPENKFCGQCAAPLRTTPTAKFATPDSYTPKYLAEKILTSKAALEGERKQVTILFADLKGSMELLADRDPEEARKLLDPVLERMMEAVHRFEGTVNQVMGDGIMALFGAPLAHEDHAVRACYAALRIQDTVGRYAEAVRHAEDISIQVRVGLNSGEVVVRSIGSDLRMDYTAVGQTTHLAARMEQMANPGRILLTRETVALAEGFVQVESLGPMHVKGLPDLIEIFELTRASPVRSRFQAAAARGLTRFVGRDAEIASLRQALDRARNGRGQVVSVIGEPGVGKSRLVWEFSHSHHTRDWLLLEAPSVSYGKATIYFPAIELLKSYLQIEQHDDARKIREKLTGKLLSLDRSLEPTSPALLSLLDIPVDDPDWERLDPPQRRRQTLDALRGLLLRESQVQPLVLVFEDLHWIDSETQGLLDILVESVPMARVLLLISYRPEYTHAWASKTYYQQIRLDVLPAATADELLSELLGRDANLSALRRLLIERTEGNPFFLEEAVRSLAETSTLVGESGAYRLARPVRELALPATAQAILASRIDRLAPEDKRLLQTAAVVGKDVPIALIRAIADGADEQVRAGLARLQAAEFLYEAQLFPDLEYTFKHALTHEVAYGSLLGERRRSLHATLVTAYERIYGDRLTEHVERLADHATKGELWDKAVTYARGAGSRCMASSAYRDGVAHFEHALIALSRLPEESKQLTQAIDIRLDLRSLLVAIGEGARAFACLREAEGLARRLGDRRRVARVAVSMTHQLWLAGQTVQVREYGAQALEQAEALDEPGLKIAIHSYLGQAAEFWADFPRVELHMKRVLDLVADHPWERGAFSTANVFPAVLARANLGAARSDQGEFAAGLRVAEEAVGLAETLRHPFSIGYSITYLAYVFEQRGDYKEVAEVCERGLSLGGEASLVFLSPYLRGFLAHARISLSGAVTEELLVLESAVKAQAAMGFRYGLSLLFCLLSADLLLAGRQSEALTEAERGMTLAVDCGERRVQARFHHMLGEIAAWGESARLDLAETEYQRGLVLATELGARPVVAHCRLGLGKLYRRTGQRSQARENLANATSMYREMDIQFWLKQAESEMAALR